MKLLCFLFCTFGVMAEQLPADKLAQIEKLITTEMSRQHIPGLSIAIARGQDSLWSNGYGFSDLENFVPAKASTVYRTASIAKPITAVAAMQLVERGLLELDAPIQKYVPAFPQKPFPLTTRQLLGHLAGIRSYKDAAEDFNTHHYWNLEEVVKTFQDDALVSEPGSAYLYSTLGFDLAGLVLEHASGKPYLQFIEANVFAPAGMTSTRADDVYRLIPNRSRGYEKSSAGDIQNAALLDTSSKLPGGGLCSTAADLARFAMAVDSGKLLSPASTEAMFTSQRTKDGKLTNYGLGWGIADFRGHPVRTHSGGQAGVSTVLYYFPADHLAIVVLSNLQQTSFNDLLHGISEIVLN